MERLRNWALRFIIVLNVLATVVAFGESYSGLYQWAIGHQITGFWGGVWPLMIDVIILIAEAGLFVAHHDKWKTRHKAWLWTVMMVALGVSVGGNTGHIHSTDVFTHLSAALAPLALAFALTVGFGVMKRTFINKPKPAPVAPPTPAVEIPLAGWHPVVDTERARAHVGTAPWVGPIETESFPLTGMVKVPHSAPETPLTEKPAPVLPESLEPTETFAGVDFKVTDKSWTSPRDPRTGLNLKRQRVRDMFDLDPDISANAIAKANGIAWATAAKYLAETKEARGLELTEQERQYLTSTASS